MLVDTSVWIDFFNSYPSAEAERLAGAIGESEATALPGVFLTEIPSTIDCLIARLALRDRLPVLTKDRDFRAIAQHCPPQLVTVS